MLTAEARVPTTRASRYLVQVCRHATRMTRHRPGPVGKSHDGASPEVRGVAWTDRLGIVRFGSGCCVLQARPDTLVVSVDATGEDELQWLVAGITRRLVTIGRRDQLTVNWRRDRQPDLAPGQPTAPTPVATAKPALERVRAPRCRRFASALLLAGAAVLAIVIHLGLIGGALAASVWAKWGVNLVLALVLIKVVLVGGHVVLGRFVLRRAPAMPPLLGRIPLARRRSSPDSISGAKATEEALRKRDT